MHVELERLLTEHEGELRRFLAARCRDADLAADLLQETSARLLAAAPGLRPNGNPRAYLFRAAANVWRDHVRREIVQRRALETLHADEPRRAPPADALVLTRDLAAAVRRAVALLPAPQREVLELRHRSDLTFRVIAERLGRPLGTVLTQMRAALIAIDRALEDYR